MINIHPSLLPSFRGKNAVKQALEKRVKTAGCSVHYVDEGIDTGEIISQEKVPVSSNDDEETLGKKILKKEHVLYIKVIKELESKEIYFEADFNDKEDLKELLDLSNKNLLKTNENSWQKVEPLYPISPIN